MEPNRYEMPQGWGMAPSPSEERAIPVNNLPASDPAMQRRNAAMDGEIARRAAAEQMIAEGVHPSLAEFRSTIDFELDRATIPADLFREFDPGYEGDQPVSPRQFIQNQADLFRLEQELEGRAVPDLEEIVDATIAGFKGDDGATYTRMGIKGFSGSAKQMAEDARSQLLAALNAASPKGDYSDKSGIAEQELEGLREQYGDSANFMYPERLQSNFDALRQFELFNAQGDGGDVGNPSTTASMALKGVGQFFDPSGQTSEEFLSLASQDPVVGKAMSAMQWYNSSKPDQNFDGYQAYRDPETNDSRFFRFSTTGMQGLMDGMGGSTDRRYGRWNADTSQPWMNPNTTDRQRAFLASVQKATKRPVPVVLRGLTSDDMDNLSQFEQDYSQKSDDYLAAQTAKGLGTYPSPLVDTFLNMGRYLGEPANLVDMGASIATGGIAGALTAPAKGAFRRMVRNAGEAVGRNVAEENLENAPTEAAFLAANNQSLTDYVLPRTENSLAVDGAGNQIHPLDPRFGKTVDESVRRQGEELEEQSRQFHEKTGNRYYKPVKAPAGQLPRFR